MLMSAQNGQVSALSGQFSVSDLYKGLISSNSQTMVQESKHKKNSNKKAKQERVRPALNLLTQFSDDVEESIKADQDALIGKKDEVKAAPQQELASTTVKTGNKIQAGLELTNYNNQ